MVTPPRCREPKEGTDGAVRIESDRLDTVDVTEKRNPFLSFLESNFGGNDKKEKSPVEMTEMPMKISPRRIEHPADFDICREYSYDLDEEEEEEATPKNALATSFSRMMGGEKVDEATLSKVCVLGKIYHPIHDFGSRRDDESTLFWYTYRSDFPEIAPYGITSDAGWGCMLRASQMMLGQALRMHYKSRSWRPPHLLARRRQDPFVRSMYTWFADYPSAHDCLYSLHNMVAAGMKYDKLPGEWYGPGTACYVMRDLVLMHERQQQSGKAAGNQVFRIYVAPQGTVYRDEVDALMTKGARAQAASDKPDDSSQKELSHPLEDAWSDELVESASFEWDTGMLLLIPLRLGLNSFNENYIHALTNTFALPQSVGVLGGRPRGARWFYGAEMDGSKIFGLDPHTVQTAPRRRFSRVNGRISSVVELSDDYLRSCHTTYPEAFALDRMDPSIALGFYCRTAKDFEHVLASVQRFKETNPNSPELFTIADKSPDYSANVSSFMNDMVGSSLFESAQEIDEEDDYVVL